MYYDFIDLQAVDTQQKLIAITAFNLTAICYCHQQYIRGSSRISVLANSVRSLQIYLERLGATVAINDNANLEQQIIQSLDTHKNLLKVSDNDQDVVDLMRPVINLADGNGLSGFKAHKLTSTTMLNSIPAILLQLYSNPCIHWLHVPAFYLLAQQLTNDRGRSRIFYNFYSKTQSIQYFFFLVAEQIQAEVRKLRQIFQNEFVTDKFDADAVSLPRPML